MLTVLKPSLALGPFVTVILAGMMAFAQSPKDRKGYDGKTGPTLSSEVPEVLQNVGIEEKLGETIDLSLMVTNEKGETVTLASLLPKGQPLLLSPIYFNCPALCSFHFNGVVESLKQIDWSAGKQFQVLAFSFDAKETPEMALKKKESYMKMYDRAGTEDGFHFAVAEESVVNTLMDQVGFKFKWNPAANDWAHSSAAIMISPEGKITRYLHGLEFNPKDMKLSLNEAGNGKVGSIIDSAILYCFQYDASHAKYGLQVFRVVQIGGLLMIGLLIVWLVPNWIRSRREKV